MPPDTRQSKLDSAAFYIFLASIFLAPIAFWSSQYFALDSVKTLVIGALSMTVLLLASLSILKRKEAVLPPKSMSWLGLLLAISVLASSISSGHFVKSFFGQGFEMGAGAFMIAIIGAGLAAFFVVSKRADRAMVLYAGVFGSFILVWLIQILRIIFGPGFMSLGILSNVTSSILGSWFSFGIFSAAVAVLSFSAIHFLRLSRRMKIACWALFAASAVALFVVNSRQAWEALAAVFLGLSIYLSSQRARPEGGAIKAFLRWLSWMPIVFFIVSSVLAWQGIAIAGPLVAKLNAGYTEISMPWQMTLDIASGQLKATPFLGIGPNRFTQAFLAFKPAAINTTDAWGVEFSAGFGLIPTFAVTQGLVGLIAWILFLVYFGMLGTRSLRGLVRGDGLAQVAEAEKPYARFVIVSSYSVAALIWLFELVYVPSHAVVFLGFVMTGIWLGSSVAYGKLKALTVLPGAESSGRTIKSWASVAFLISLFLLVAFVKNAAALGYFAAGAKHLTADSQPVAADASFSKALSLNPLDVYWQARAEANIAVAQGLLSVITATTTASSSSAIVAEASKVVNDAVGYASQAIQSDPDNYNNYVSQARVAELATAMHMQNGYESAVSAYQAAIAHNPGNPSLYLSLAQVAASQQKYKDAIQAIGAALQVKQNYLDAVYLLSQVEAADGNLPDAITAATFATQLNPNQPLLFFQLGLLNYNKPDYDAAEKAFSQAIKLSPDYANAQYFLGLTEARLGKSADAIATFTSLAKSNPDNQEVPLILQSLRAGKSIFSPGPQQQAARPEKRSTPPLKQR